MRIINSNMFFYKKHLSTLDRVLMKESACNASSDLVERRNKTYLCIDALPTTETLL